MNYLALCRDVARESGTLAGGVGSIATVVGAQGRIDKIASWVAKAWTNIQNEHDDWFWMRREFEATLAAGTPRYAPAALNLTRLGSWVTMDEGEYALTIQDPDKGRADEVGIAPIDFPIWRSRYGRGYHDPARPTEFSVSPQRELAFGATPDKAYIVRGLYVASPQVLVADNDVPEMPEQYHSAIVWEAIKLMSIADEAPTALQTSVGEYARVRDAMQRDQRPTASISYGADVVIA